MKHKPAKRRPRQTASSKARHAVGDSAARADTAGKPTPDTHVGSDCWMAERLQTPADTDVEAGVAIDTNPQGDTQRGRARESKRGQR
jgi:hypothetical protein